MSFKFSILSLERIKDCVGPQVQPMAYKRKPTKLTKALKKCKGKKGEKWNSCLKKEGIKKKSGRKKK